jgi:hypothetical protein
MALKDLKSDLSKFRRPIEKPLIDKKRVDVPKSSNQTPLSQFVDKTPSAPKSNTTTPKQGVTPNKFDNSSNYLGETSQTKFDNSSNYLGETTPSKMSLSERFLGQTETQEVQQGDKFKGETETANITQGDRFKGQTTPQDYSNAEKFKGETNPTEFKFTQQFLGETTPTDSSLTERFLGETTPTKFDLSENFLGETSPADFNSEEQFLGETTPTDFNLSENFLGETTPSKFEFNPHLETQATEPKFVDFITNDDAKGFSPFQQPRNNSTFVGVDPSQTQFEGVTPISGQFVINQYGVTRDNDGGLGTTYTDKLLKDTYNKFNLKEDSYNSSIFKQPFILSGIQKEKGEPETLGVGSFSFIRGGAITSTARAAIDVVRMGQFLLTPRGITWGLKQVGMQRSQKYGKQFTPINLLASLGGQHLGLKFDRPGVQPLGDETWKYSAAKRTAQTLAEEYSPDTRGGRLLRLYDQIDFIGSGLPFPSEVDTRGGFDSFYGIGITNTTRGVNTFGDKLTLEIGFTNYGDYFKQNKEGKLTTQVEENSPIPLDKVFKERGLYESEGKTAGFGNDISDYESISYGTIQKIQTGDASNYKGDFRNLKTQVARGVDSNGNVIPAADDYVQNNLRRTYGFGQTFKTNAQRITNDRLDTIGMSGVGSPEQDDIVKLVFKTNSSNLCQFRGTVSGITETFSPSWNPEKPNGRADKMYMMTEFERTLSFNFKAVAYSRMELIPMWEKLKQLATFAMPFYGDSVGYRGRPLEFTLGDLWKNHTSLLTSLSYTMSDETAWETDKNYTIPKLVDISIGLTLVGDSIHSENSTPNLYDYGV